LLFKNNLKSMAHKITNINFQECWKFVQETVKKIITLDNISRDAWYKCFDIFDD